MAAPYPILILVRALDAGGTERQATEIAKSLDRSRFEPHVGCFRPDGMRFQELTATGVPVLCLSITSFLRPSILAAVHRLDRYIRDHGIQLVHAFDPPSVLFGVPAARMLRVPVVLSSQRSSRSLRSAASRHLLRLADRVVDGVVVNCRAVRDSLIDERVPASLLHLCYNGIDLTRFHPPECRRRSGGPLVVAYIGVFRREKDILTLLEAFRRLQLPHVDLRLVGSGPNEAEVREQCSALGIEGRCSFLPFTAQVERCLEEVDVFVLPSRSEALSNSLMEAMACGCAVIASRVGGNPELVSHGETGLLFEPGDSADLAAQLQRLAGDPELRERLGRAAAAKLRSQFGMATSAERMGRIYQSFLG